MKILIAYYSRTGNNKFIAKKLSASLNADLYEIIPRLNVFFFLILSSLLKIGFGNKKTKHRIETYDKIILCGPIWMGQLISPLFDFIKKNKNTIKALYFATCCGGGESEKDSPFGYNGVFKKVKMLLNDSFIAGEAFSIDAIIPDELKGKTDEIMKLKLSEETFNNSTLLKKYDNFIQIVKKES